MIRNPGSYFRTRTKKNLLIISILILAIIAIPVLTSCNRRLPANGPSRQMPSAYTHTGRYIKHVGLRKNHSGVRRYAIKCPIAPARR